jgi:hypothetical protein
MGRTTQSLFVVCETGPANYYYRGLRLSDGASIELANVVRSSDGFDVTNPNHGGDPAWAVPDAERVATAMLENVTP